ncbi:uncharacterized protein LOC120429319 [Culex pipiens pallens]|uniref:uncharacterized protein LOC120429319 n=1 Tax=Culex pipiens pallens TaxID=42434 RepID=UPI001953BE28|nr:uncharacterized protein LOC120429319 [Culex pipiens pallens]
MMCPSPPSAEASLVDWRRAEMVRTGRPNIFSARDLPPRSPIGIERYTCKSVCSASSSAQRWSRFAVCSGFPFFERKMDRSGLWSVCSVKCRPRRLSVIALSECERP